MDKLINVSPSLPSFPHHDTLDIVTGSLINMLVSHAHYYKNIDLNSLRGNQVSPRHLLSYKINVYGEICDSVFTGVVHSLATNK